MKLVDLCKEFRSKYLLQVTIPLSLVFLLLFFKGEDYQTFLIIVVFGISLIAALSVSLTLFLIIELSDSRCKVTKNGSHIIFRFDKGAISRNFPSGTILCCRPIYLE